MSRNRGLRLQNALATYLTAWWPYAESAGSGRPGTDVRGTPGIVWECKTAGTGSRNIGAWIDQAKKHKPSADEIPVVVYYPPGIGEAMTERTIAMMPLGTLMRLLAEAGYTAGGDKYRG